MCTYLVIKGHYTTITVVFLRCLTLVPYQRKLVFRVLLDGAWLVLIVVDLVGLIVSTLKFKQLTCF